VFPTASHKQMLTLTSRGTSCFLLRRRRRQITGNIPATPCVENMPYDISGEVFNRHATTLLTGKLVI